MVAPVNVTDLDVDNNLNVDGNAKVDGTSQLMGILLSAMLLVTLILYCTWFNSTKQSPPQISQQILLPLAWILIVKLALLLGSILILDSATGETQVDDNLTVTGTLDVNGNTTIGNANTDAHELMAQ